MVRLTNKYFKNPTLVVVPQVTIRLLTTLLIQAILEQILVILFLIKLLYAHGMLRVLEREYPRHIIPTIRRICHLSRLNLLAQRSIRIILAEVAEQPLTGKKRVNINIVHIGVVQQGAVAQVLDVQVLLKQLDENILNTSPYGIGRVLDLVELGRVLNELAVVDGGHLELLKGQVDQLVQEFGVVLDRLAEALAVAEAALGGGVDEFGVVDEVGLEDVRGGGVDHLDELAEHGVVDLGDDCVDHVAVALGEVEFGGCLDQALDGGCGRGG